MSKAKATKKGLLDVILDCIFPRESRKYDPHIPELSREDERIRDPHFKFSGSGRGLWKN